MVKLHAMALPLPGRGSCGRLRHVVAADVLRCSLPAGLDDLFWNGVCALLEFSKI
jgi:hypothetical protein